MSHYSYTDEQLQELVSSSHNWNEVLNKLNMKTMTRSLQRRIKSANIEHKHISTYFDGLHTKFNKLSKEQLIDIIKKHTDWNDFMKEIGYKSCTHLPIIKKKLENIQIDYTHLESSKPKINNARYSLDEILVEDSTYCGGMRILLKRLKRERGWEHQCSICKLTEWNDKPIPLEIDHIDGCHTNNTYTNLRPICPNCHAQTDTYKGKNMRVCKENQIKLIENPPLPPKPKSPPHETNYCTGCSKEIHYRHTQCNACKAKEVFESGQTRKVKRPSYEQLLTDLQQQSMVKVGQKYGVSDNAVRKWLKTYEKYITHLENLEDEISQPIDSCEP
jgi:hypothetical protein